MIPLVSFDYYYYLILTFVGLAVDGGSNKERPHDEMFLLRKTGKVSNLADAVKGLILRVASK